MRCLDDTLNAYMDKLPIESVSKLAQHAPFSAGQVIVLQTMVP